MIYRKSIKAICLIASPYIAFALAGKYTFSTPLPQFTHHTGDILGILNCVSLYWIITIIFREKQTKE